MLLVKCTLHFCQQSQYPALNKLHTVAILHDLQKGLHGGSSQRPPKPEGRNETVACHRAEAQEA